MSLFARCIYFLDEMLKSKHHGYIFVLNKHKSFYNNIFCHPYNNICDKIYNNNSRMVQILYIFFLENFEVARDEYMGEKIVIYASLFW